jgi:hypothetical protein
MISATGMIRSQRREVIARDSRPKLELSSTGIPALPSGHLRGHKRPGLSPADNPSVTHCGNAWNRPSSGLPGGGEGQIPGFSSKKRAG